MPVLSDPVPETWCPPALGPALEALGALEAGHAALGTSAHLLLLGGAGTGKSFALRLLAEHAGRLGLGVVEGTASAPRPEEGGPAVRLVDDAHDLETSLADLLAEDAATGRVLVLAARPWPQTEAFAQLMGRLHGHGVVMLGTWEAADVRAYLEATGAAGTDGEGVVGRLVRLSGGLPWLVGALVAVGPEATATDVAGLVQARFRRLSTTARALVEELAVGFAVDDCPSGEQLDPDAFDSVLAEVDAAGLLATSGDLPPAVATAVAEDLPVHRRRRLQRQVLPTLPTRGTDAPLRYARVAGAGVHDARLAAGLVDIGDAALVEHPAEATGWYDLAETAGATATALAARRAEAALRTGHPDTAARLIDVALSAPEQADPARTAHVALGIFGRAGVAVRATELVRLLGPAPSAAETAAAVIVLLGQGQHEEVDRLAGHIHPDAALPTRQEETAVLVIGGLVASLGRTPADALPGLARAAQMSTVCDEALVPMHPGVLAGLAALLSGDLALAELTVERARTSTTPGKPWYRPLTLLAAWIRMTAGDLAGAARLRGEASGGTWPATGRDALWDAALDVGLARRGDDPHALAHAWQGISAELVTYTTDLYDLLPLGELHLASVRVRDEAPIAPHLRAAWSILAGLGSPPLWETSLHWDAIQGAILANRPQDIAPHAQALVRHAATFPYAATLASAGRVWVQVLAERFDVDEVVAAAHRLRDVGQSWQAGRLLGHAAAHADARKDSARLLESARALGDSASASSDRGGPTQLPLSEREQQVARLVLAGHTYKEVGGRLFLSERTVEHHMARIRQRLGAASRGELLERLRSMLDEVDVAAR